MEELKVSVIRGNAGEILALAGTAGEVRGVDSLTSGVGHERLFISFASSSGAVVAVSGETDFVTDGRGFIKVYNGNPLMGRVTGTGCGATTAAACFAASSGNTLHAVAAGITCYNIAGELACMQCRGPGSFVPEFLDNLAGLSESIILKNARIETGS